MKKPLLLAALAFATLGNAQPVSGDKPLAGRHYPRLDMRQQMADMPQTDMSQAGVQAVPQPRRTKSAGVYYSRPEGAYYLGFNLNGKGYYPSVISVAPWHTVTFANANPKTPGQWHMYAYNQKLEPEGEMLDDPTSPVNAEGNYEWSQGLGDFFYTPTLTIGEESFAIGQANRYMRSTGRNYVGRIICDTLLTVVAADDHQAYEYHGTVYSNSVALGIFSDNMYGTGEAYDQYVSYGAAQPFDRPMSPLYVEKVFAHGSSNNRQPIAEGDTLFCYVSRCTKRTMANGTVIIMPTYEYTDTLYALPSDTVGFSTTDKRNDSTIYPGSLIYTKHEADAQGIVRSVPFIIDPADFDENGFAFVFSGFDRPGMDAGIWGYRVNTDVDDVKLGLMLFRDINTGEALVNYYGGISMQVGMVCMYDGVKVADDNGKNRLTVSADGQTCVAETTGGAAGAEVYTATSWYDADGNAQYSLVDAPDWMTGVKVDGSKRGKAGTTGLNIVSFVCEPLPWDVVERTAAVYVRGRGVTSTTPIIIRQDGAEGIGTTDAAPKGSLELYNAKGQKVGSNAKGLIIQKGKKIYRK